MPGGTPGGDIPAAPPATTPSPDDTGSTGAGDMPGSEMPTPAQPPADGDMEMPSSPAMPAPDEESSEPPVE